MSEKQKAAQATKRILIVIAGAEGEDKYRDVALLPGTTVRDVLHELGIDDFRLRHPDGSYFALQDDLYAAVESGTKLFTAKGDAEAGLQTTQL
jgi:hypothetical protein